MHPIAINIFLIPSKEIKDICDNIYINDKSEYSSEGLDYFPHITLSQKGFSKADLKKLIFDLEKLKINKFELETGDFRFGNLFGLAIKRNKYLNELQKKIIGIVGNYPDVKLNKNSFLTKKSFFEDNFNWVNNYTYNVDFTKYLHITLGKDNQIENIGNIILPKTFIFCALGIGLMGNYCSVRKIIKEFR